MNGLAKNDTPRRKWTVKSTGDSGWLYTNDDMDEWEDSLTEIRVAKFRQGPGDGYDDDDEEDWAEEDDWDDDDDFDDDDFDDDDWDDDEEEDSDEW